ncbi:MAG: hypothetical protein C0605_06105 [Hyphomicrobiales bacterium]|nr:MAG: hypothetical protein C0605_06105 [Hyphomicrobiales bacterium]
MAVDIRGVDLKRLDVGLTILHEDPAPGEDRASSSTLRMTLDELKVFLKALTKSGDVEITSSLLSADSGRDRVKPAMPSNRILEIRNKYMQIVGSHPG